jgi:hypothetical protein
MSSRVPFSMNGLYISPCCNRYWQGVVILQGKDKAVVNTQLLVHHVRLKHAGRCVSHSHNLLPQPETWHIKRAVLTDVSRLRITLTWRRVLCWHITSLRSKLLSPFSRFCSKQQTAGLPTYWRVYQTARCHTRDDRGTTKRVFGQ